MHFTSAELQSHLLTLNLSQSRLTFQAGFKMSCDLFSNIFNICFCLFLFASQLSGVWGKRLLPLKRLPWKIFYFLLLCCIFPSDYLNEPGAPFASTIGSHSVTLGWKPANISGVKYIIQWKFNQLPGDWRYTEVEDNFFYFTRK